MTTARTGSLASALRRVRQEENAEEEVHQTGETYDPVSFPKHYADGRNIQPIDVIDDWSLDFNLGSVIKYIGRAGRKEDELQDLEKALWYLERRISVIRSRRGE